MARDSSGRMIRKGISDSKKFASLSPNAAILFAMMIPHYNAHGKMIGGAGYIKEVVCPRIEYIKSESIPGLLREISDKTNVKWFEFDGRMWIHSLNFLNKHQELRKDRMGPDTLPDYSGTTPVVVHPEVKIKIKSKSKGIDALLEHEFQTFKSLMPLNSDGVFAEEDECREYWMKNQSLKAIWLAAVGNYRNSKQVKDGFPCSPLNFLKSKYQGWDNPQPVNAPQKSTGAIARLKAEESKTRSLIAARNNE